jgi:hypothetical protein
LTFVGVFLADEGEDFCVGVDDDGLTSDVFSFFITGVVVAEFDFCST